MKLIPTYLHGVLDYAAGACLIFSPELFGFAWYGGEPVAFIRMFGVILILHAFLTDFELGAIGLQSVGTHLINDYLYAGFLAASPWLFQFDDVPLQVWKTYIGSGVLLFLLALFTEPISGRFKLTHPRLHN